MKRISKLDFGYLVNIKKKILFQNIPNRLIRNKNRRMLKFRKTYKVFPNVFSKGKLYHQIQSLNSKKFIWKIVIKGS
jgi:hypothetical protein